MESLQLYPQFCTFQLSLQLIFFLSFFPLQRQRSLEELLRCDQRCEEDCRGRIQDGQIGPRRCRSGSPPPPPLLSTCHYPFCGLPAAIRRAGGRAHFDSEQVGMAHRKPIMWPIDEQRQQEWQAVLIARFSLSPPTQRGSIELRPSNIISFSIKVLHSLSDEYLSETR